MNGLIFIALCYEMAPMVFGSTFIFFHELSSVSIYPEVRENHSDFGFAMGFQRLRNKLVIGAPSVDLKGKVYSCDMNGLVPEIQYLKCHENSINFDVLAKYPKGNQHFYTGSSIAATSEYFLTCAPLWTFQIPNKNIDAAGTCFIFDGHHDQPKRYNGIYEQFWKQSKIGDQRKLFKMAKKYLGGTGWNTLVDEDNALLLIVKTSLDPDIVFTDLDKPETNTKSISNIITLSMQKVYNFGFGLTSGKFFSNKTVFAFSMYTRRMEGVIEFLEYDKKSRQLTMINENIAKDLYTIHSKSVATMFGSTMAAEDLNMDGLSELLVGEPIYTEEDCVECGAFHIYMGGEMRSMGDRNSLSIIGSGEFGRFGKSIATKDLDGDGKPELVISAPYEDQGVGAIYILSGYEVYQKLPEHLRLRVSEFKYTQRIQKKSLRSLGYSLQFTFDTDNNGCDELVAGAPGSGIAVLFKCVQVINVTLSYNDVQTVREQDTSFNVGVCVNVEYPKKPRVIFANLTVTNSIIGEATNIPTPNLDLDISCNNCPEKKTFCENVTVVLLDKEQREYTFKSQIIIHTDHVFKRPEFNGSWVVASPYSELKKNKLISRHCKGNDCIPQLSMEILWSGSNNTYVLGSSAKETATILVRNYGNSSYEACVSLQVNGAPLSKDTILFYCTNYKNGHICQLLPKPFKRDTKRSIELLFDMTKPTNEYTTLSIKAELYLNCYIDSSINSTLYMNISYVIPTHDILIEGNNHSKIITDKKIMSETHFDSDLDEQEYLIINNGSILWKQVVAKISMEKKPFIITFKVSTSFEDTCEVSHTASEFIQTCILDLRPNSSLRITATTEILKTKIQKHLNDGKIVMKSRIKLDLKPLNKSLVAIAESLIVYQKELTLANNKWLIGLIVAGIALLILLIIFTVLYRRGFFKRKQKQRLHILRESIKQRNSRRSTPMSSTADEQGLENMEYDNDSAFEDIPISQVTKLPKIEENIET